MADEKQASQAKLAKVNTLLEALEELHTKERQIVEELRVVIGGGVSIGALLKQAEKKFSEMWSTRYPHSGNYVWSYAKDRTQMKRLIATLGISELEARIVNYIKNQDPFFVQKRHPFGLFVTTINQHTTKTDTPDLELAGADADGNVPGCRHDPPCRTDLEHTRKRNLEMRGVPA